MKNKIHNQDWINGLKSLPDESVQCCVTSPPYWGLRDYGTSGQMGLERTPEEYVEKIVRGFREARRVLKKDGTLWLNLGDSYAAAAKKRNDEQACRKSNLKGGKGSQIACKDQVNKITGGLKPKDLVGIPWMAAFALRADGWYLRQDIIWAKAYTTLEENFGSAMPESVTDRFVKSHEQLFLLSKSSKYYFDIDAIKKPIKESSSKRLSQDIENQNGSERVPGKTNGTMKAVKGTRFGGNKYDNNDPKNRTKSGNVWAPQMAREGSSIVGHSGDVQSGLFANKRSVWHCNPSGFKGDHFATFPEELIVDCIKAGCPEDGIVLDPFMGAGTTALVARKLNRNYIGFELNADYIKIAEKRLYDELGLFLDQPQNAEK